jgi:hypothetical protein
VSRILTVTSLLEEAIRLPSGLDVTPVTQSARRPRSRAEGDSRSDANKAWQHESRFRRLRARADRAGRVGVVGPKQVDVW